MAGDDHRIDRYVDRLMRKFRIPGMALGIYEEGVLTCWRCRGKVSLTFDVETSIDSVFQLASVTKQFTGAAVALLDQRDKYDFSLDDPLIRHLPDRYRSQAPTAWSGITVRHLLNHTSGLPNRFEAKSGADPTTSDFHTWRMSYDADQLFDGARDEEPRLGHRPGTGFLYSDTGYFLLGLIIKKVSGSDFKNFVQKNFFKPLGMHQSRMVDRRRVMKRMANAYRWDTELKENMRDRLREVREEVKSHYGAISTILDLARWEAELHDPKILNKKSLKAMFTPHKEERGLPKHPKGYRWGYGLGWFWSKLDGQVILSHSGITGTFYMRVPDRETSLVLLTNQSRLADDGDLLPKIGLNILRKYRSDILRPGWREYMPGHVKRSSEQWI